MKDSLNFKHFEWKNKKRTPSDTYVFLTKYLIKLEFVAQSLCFMFLLDILKTPLRLKRHVIRVHVVYNTLEAIYSGLIITGCGVVVIQGPYGRTGLLGEM